MFSPIRYLLLSTINISNLLSGVYQTQADFVDVNLWFRVYFNGCLGLKKKKVKCRVLISNRDGESETTRDLGYKWRYLLSCDKCQRDNSASGDHSHLGNSTSTVPAPLLRDYTCICRHFAYYFLPQQEVNRFLPFQFLYCFPSCVNVSLMEVYLKRVLVKTKFQWCIYFNVSMLKDFVWIKIWMYACVCAYI